MSNKDYQTSSSIAKEESILTKTASLKSQNQLDKNKRLKQRVSRRVTLAANNERISIVCPDTGVASILNIPSIPGSVLEWTSPFCSLHNCRGLVQQGTEYLHLLDTQVLAGILITIGESYSLFRYQPADTGAQKNAVLRTAGKLLLINDLLLIEDYINSRNRCFLPTLSLVMDAKIEEGGISAIMTEWLKLCAAVIIKSDFPELADASHEDTFYSEVPKRTITPEYVRARRKSDKASKALNWEATNKKWAEQRVYKEDIKAAKAILKTFATVETISPKLLGLLKSVFNEDSLLTMDSATRSLLATKLSSFTSSAADALVAIVNKPYAVLREENLSLDLDDLDDDSTLPSEEGEANESMPATPSEESSIPSIEAPLPSESILPVEKKLSFAEKVKARLELLRSQRTNG